jgi:16S rRNA (uracil1498-N3)-methyltransferase
MSVPRFFEPGAQPGARLRLSEPTARHAREVLRLRAGALVHLFDGAGHEFEATLEEVSRRTVVARLVRAVAARPESPLALTLALSPLRGDRMELVLQKATELGVTVIRPVVTARTDSAARPALRGARDARWERVAASAAEQCGRAVVPRLVPATTLARLLAEPCEQTRVALLETPGYPPLAAHRPQPAGLLLLVGPAGGFEPREVDRLLASGFRAASLGPRRLRAETAAVAAVALAQALWGDLGPIADTGERAARP